MFDGTMALDTAVALQTFGNRPTAFRRIRDEDESPYELLLCGAASTELRTIGLSVGDGSEHRIRVCAWARFGVAKPVVTAALPLVGASVRNSG